MAAPSYTTDLTTLSDCELATRLVEPTAAGWTSLSTMTYGDTDFFIQGSKCVSAAVKIGVGGIIFNNTTGITIPTNGAVLVWIKFDAPNCLDVESNGGARTIIGNAKNTFYAYKHLGSDSYMYGGWVCLATADPSAITADYTVGAPTSTRQYFGWAYKAPTNYPAKGNAFGMDAIRYGRCEFRVSGGDGSGYATFVGMAAMNDANDATNGYNRWGLFQAIEGGYKWQGLITLGYGSAVDFRDSNINIVVANTKKVTYAFNTLEIKQATSRVDWTNINISALGTVSRGLLTVVDNADVNLQGCSFSDMGVFTFQSNSSVSGTTFRRCDYVTAGGGTFGYCDFIDSTGAYALSTTYTTCSGIHHCTFTTSGTGHGLQIGGSFGGITNAYVTFEGLNWEGYAATNGSSGNEAIYVNGGMGKITITLLGTTATPSVKTAGTTVVLIVNPVDITLTATTVEGTTISGASVLLKAASGGYLPYEATVTISNSGTTATVTHTSHNMSSGDKVLIKGASLTANNGVFTITVISTSSYSYTMGSSPGSSPTGTIKATFVALYDITDSNGEVTTTRVFSENQPVTGWARRATDSPYYKTGRINSTVDSDYGLSASIILITDT